METYGKEIDNTSALVIKPSEIVWKTGKPKENGEYLVTRYSPLGKGRIYVQTNYYCDGKWLVEVLDASYVTAWCLLSDINPL